MRNDGASPSGTKNSRTWIRKLTYGGLLLAVGIVLPQVLHLTGGPTYGATFLPMHIPVLIAGLLLGPVYGLIIGGITPALSFMITGMPMIARLPFMVIELCAYGIASGFFYHTAGFSRFRFPRRFHATGDTGQGVSNPERLTGIYISLIFSMIVGRFVYAFGLLLTGRFFGLEKADPAAVLTAVTTGIVGIIIQLLIIPPILFALQKGGLTNGLVERSRLQT